MAAMSPYSGSDTLCHDCNVEMDQIEKTTFSGRDMREYQCPKCGRTQILDRGKALWEILSEANQEAEKNKKQPQIAADSPKSKKKWFKKFLSS